MRPVIGVSPLIDEKRNSIWMLPGYVDALAQAGGLPVIIPPTTDEDALSAYSEMCDGLLLAGGQDVDPALYGAPRSPLCGEPCETLDVMEGYLLGRFLDSDKPVFGICRGLQFLNAALGGTLTQDIPSELGTSVCHSMTPPYDRVVHRVDIARPSPLYDIAGRTSLGVNSYHHQCVKELSPRLTAAAVSEDGITEAAYMPGKRFVLAVQWHPELSYKSDEVSRALFGGFVRAARRV